MTTNPKHTFQSLILALEKFWAEQGCLIWQPYYQQVGAGTYNPATFLHVLGPEPWNVAYVEPSIRPDDGRYGENPNRFQQHYQYQVILKPDPGNPQEIYLKSLEAIGLDPRQHDIRFVEDNWESPALGAWGLGWEVWVDGQEITQFTYFQQAGGIPCDPVSVELTYGLERILIALRNASGIWDEPWNGQITYGDVLRQGEWEHSKYYFEIADVERMRQAYALYEAECKAALDAGLVLPAYDYVLKLSHTFNILDARGAIGVTERAASFAKMRGLARKVAEAYLEQRQRLEYPLLKEQKSEIRSQESGVRSQKSEVRGSALQLPISDPQTLLLEIGTEELPAADVGSALAQLKKLAPKMLDEARVAHGDIAALGTPRRLAVLAKDVAPRQSDSETIVKGPPAARAFDSFGAPTPAAEGFARSKGVPVSALEKRTMDGGEYVVAIVRETGKPTIEVLSDLLPRMITALKFDKVMRWRAGDPIVFSRPIRWLVALLGEAVIPFEYAGARSGKTSRGLRPFGSPEVVIPGADDYAKVMEKAHVMIDPAERRAAIREQAQALAVPVHGRLADEGVLAEVTHLVEWPTALRGAFEEAHLALPRDVLIAVMKKHQRYFPVEKNGKLLPHFIAVRNGDSRHLDIVREGNEHVIRARFADAAFFVREDVKRKLEDFRPKLAALTFQQKLGSMLDKAERIEKLSAWVARHLQLGEAETRTALRAAHLCKADLATQMVVEMTALQGIMGGEYALRSGETTEVAQAIREHYLPASAGDALPTSMAGVAVGLADRLDSLAGLFAANVAPTGSADPFGLRRAALGVTQILAKKDIDFDLRAALNAAIDLLPASVQPAADARERLLGDLTAFLAGRVRGQLLDADYRYDVVDAILAEQGHNPARALREVKRLSEWVKRPDWPQTLAAYSRCVRITRDQKERYVVNSDQLSEPAEKDLYAAYQHVSATSVNASAAPSVDDFFAALLPMIPAISKFFDDVLVMAEDRALRENRLGLLQRIAAMATGVADFSKLEGF
ncbi:MAG TPA: glycine--tRNA ligase subunit beta [Anaerolineales bacterium]|nr:glycine--tRNA ligase subunit beta [Anaerolineales bacterium]